MNPNVHILIEAIHQAPYQCVLALTGGGTSAAAQLLEVPGGSRTILEVIVPYGEQALADFLRHRPEQCCSAETSVAMARRAYERAAWLAPGRSVAGIGATASLISARPKHGDHRLHVSCVTNETVSTYSLTLAKGTRDRPGEEAVLNRMVLNALARVFGVQEQLELTLSAEDVLQHEEHPRQEVSSAFFQNRLPAAWVDPDGAWRSLQARSGIGALLPGSFNPLHAGHWALADAAERALGVGVAFELSVDNADKPGLPEAEVRRRLCQFAGRRAVLVTRAPIFVKKAELLPGTVFVVGADTAVRIIAPRYYGSPAARNAALCDIHARDCRFLVAGRLDACGKYLGLEDLEIPEDFRALFTALPAERFRLDISSTELRCREPHAAQEETTTAG